MQMILVSGILGGGIIFGGNGDYLRTAGPAGLMTAIGYVGLNAICVMEGLSELIVLWPVSNAMVEFVRTFIDDDLALVVGLAYWYVCEFVTALLNLNAAGIPGHPLLRPCLSLRQIQPLSGTYQASGRQQLITSLAHL